MKTTIYPGITVENGVWNFERKNDVGETSIQKQAKNIKRFCRLKESKILFVTEEFAKSRMNSFLPVPFEIGETLMVVTQPLNKSGYIKFKRIKTGSICDLQLNKLRTLKEKRNER